MARSGRNFTGARSLCRLRAKKRQKLYGGVKEWSVAWQEAAETLQRCKGTVGCARDSGRNFTGARSLCRLCAKKRQKLYGGVKEWSVARENPIETCALDFSARNNDALEK